MFLPPDQVTDYSDGVKSVEVPAAKSPPAARVEPHISSSLASPSTTPSTSTVSPSEHGTTPTKDELNPLFGYSLHEFIQEHQKVASSITSRLDLALSLGLTRKESKELVRTC